jgi:hypothetical protein
MQPLKYYIIQKQHRLLLLFIKAILKSPIWCHAARGVRTHFFFGKTQISFPFLLIFLLLLQIAQVATVCGFLRKFCGFFRYCPARGRGLAGAINRYL